jgi:hypothetical protein
MMYRPDKSEHVNLVQKDAYPYHTAKKAGRLSIKREQYVEEN